MRLRIREIEGFLCIVAVGLFLYPCPGEAVTVGTVAQLMQAVEGANAGGDKTIWVQDGAYTLDSALVIRADGVTVRGVSGNREAVILRGTGMTGGVSHVFLVEGDNFTARDMTLRDVYYHAIQMQPAADAPSMINLHILDTYEQMVKIAFDDGQPGVHSDNGLVENSLFEYSAGIGPQYYIGGVDAHSAWNWVIRGNTFRNIRSPGPDVAEHAVHFWSDSRNTLVERNIIINCDRGIGFGLGDRGHQGGIIRNNVIYHNSYDGYADVGIGLESAPGVQVYNNSIYQENIYPNAIEYRFAATAGVLIANNLTNRAIAQRDGAAGTLSSNVVNAVASWFVNPSAGDLHLASPVPSVVNQGIFIEGLTEDMDGDGRPRGGGYDIGADEYGEPDPCPDCSGDAVLLEDVTFPPGGVCECVGDISITIGANVTLQTGAVVFLRTPVTYVNSEFRVGNGSTVILSQQ